MKQSKIKLAKSKVVYNSVFTLQFWPIARQESESDFAI